MKISKGRDAMWREKKEGVKEKEGRKGEYEDKKKNTRLGKRGKKENGARNDSKKKKNEDDFISTI